MVGSRQHNTRTPIIDKLGFIGISMIEMDMIGSRRKVLIITQFAFEETLPKAPPSHVAANIAHLRNSSLSQVVGGENTMYMSNGEKYAVVCGVMPLYYAVSHQPFVLMPTRSSRRLLRSICIGSCQS